MNGQAEVMSERCIGCGNCVKVCSQGAKTYYDSTQNVFDIIASGQKVAAIVAPSFPAEFTEIDDYRLFVGMIRKLGFDLVNEVAFGADMVAREYEKLLDDKSATPHISSDCPAIVYYIEQYYPKLVPALAKIASPMVAITRILREVHGEDLQVVFIGPCIAKKSESNEVNEGLTFIEVREMFAKKDIRKENTEPSEFDPPHSGKGGIFPVSRGLLHTVNKTDDICESNIVVAEGSQNFKDAIKEFEDGHISSQHLELLCCEGCIMGPGMSKGGQRYSRRTRISEFVKSKMDTLDVEEFDRNILKFDSIDLSQEFNPSDRRIPTPRKEDIDKVLNNIGKLTPQDHLNCGACGYDTCYEHAVAIVEGLAETEMCLPYTIEKLHNSVNELNLSNEKLSSAQMALKQSEKLASMGQLSAGIAHELNNPLGVITMYSNILKEEAPENASIRKDLDLIVEQANRCKNIVGGLLNFARKNQVKLVKSDINNLVSKSLSGIIKPESISVSYETSLDDPFIMLDEDQIMQVLTNLEKNAVEAMPDGGVLNISLAGNDREIELNVSDTGLGIAPENMDKLFTPFFTTKEIGKGTGLGLPLIYGIVKMHKGKIKVDSNADPLKGKTGTNFKITIPRKLDK
jgi:nitrogen-specific signal transduction histidine kinase/ferredoxin